MGDSVDQVSSLCPARGMATKRPLMTVAECAKELGVSRGTAYVYARREELPGLVSLGGHYYVRRAVFEQWLLGFDAVSTSPVRRTRAAQS